MKTIKIPRRRPESESTEADAAAMAHLQEAFRNWSAAHDWKLVAQGVKLIEELRAAEEPWRRDLAHALGQLTAAQLQNLPQILSAAGPGRPRLNREQELAEQARQFEIDQDEERAVRFLAARWSLSEPYARRIFSEYRSGRTKPSKAVRKIR